MDALRKELDIDVELIKGRGGIFQVKVGDAVVARKTYEGFPSDQAIVEAVRGALR